MLRAHVALIYSEPNLLSGTAHSVNKRGVKKRDLDVEELKEILSPLLPFVRTEHILPPNSDVLADAVGTFSPPLDALVDWHRLSTDAFFLHSICSSSEDC